MANEGVEDQQQLGNLAPGAPLLASSRPQLGIRQAFLFGLSQCCWLDQHALSLIALALPRPFNHHRLQDRGATGSARQGGIATRQVLQVVEVSTRQAERAIAFYPQQTAPIQVDAAFATAGGAPHPEDHQLPISARLLVGTGQGPARPEPPRRAELCRLTRG